jgi:FAD/FMN-containing dehydrogenase
MAAGTTITNWYDDLVSHPRVVVEAASVDHGGIPLPNRTPMATRTQLKKALDDRWKQFAAARRTFDPNNRLLNNYFRGLPGE